MTRVFQVLRSFVIAVIVYVALDSLWLGVIARTFYQHQLRNVSGGVGNHGIVHWFAAVAAYIMIVGGLVLFAFHHMEDSPVKAITWGAMYGLIVYSVYDLTNMATLAGWSWTLVVADVAWGIVVCALVSAVTVLVNRRLKNSSTLR